MTKENTMNLELEDNEVQFLAQLLDKTTVSGIAAKSIVLRIMVKIGKALESVPEPKEISKEE